VASVGEALATRGALPSGSLVWRHTVKELECLIAGGLVAPRRGPDRWEPFVAEVIRARGRRTEGTGVVGGIGAGRAHIVPSLGSIGRPSPRLVLMAQHPLPQLSPLLWHCAGLVAASGSTGAHLFEVARSLGVPTVVGVHGAEAVAEASLVAVDGEAGAVSFLPAAGAAVDPSTREGGTVSSLVV
jgi:phosphohistidine swiveling domain-containing protein